MGKEVTIGIIALMAALGGGIPTGIALNTEGTGEFVPVIIIITLICGALGGGAAQLGFDFSANPGESFAYNMEKFAPAANGTTGFLLISFIVIILLGNIMINTCPNFIEGSVSTNTEPTSGGFVSWLQTNYPGISWSIAVIPVILITIITFLPIRDKPLKILIASVILVGLTTAALLFNSIKRLITGKKDSFTNVKEEFGHEESHPFKIAIGSQIWNEANIDNKIYYRLNNDYEEHKEDNNEYQNPGTTNYGTGNINVNYDTYNNQLTFGLDYNVDPKDVDIYYTHYPWGHPDGTPTKLEASTPITIDITNIDKKLYFHSFLKDTTARVVDVKVVLTSNVADLIKTPTSQDGYTLAAGDKILLTGQTTKTQNGVYTVGTVTAATTGADAVAENAPITKETTQLPIIKETKGNETKILANPDTTSVTESNSKGIVLWDGALDENGNVKNNHGVTTSTIAEGLTLNIKNVKIGFELQEGAEAAAGKSIKTSYHIYYPIVWGSILVYTIFQKLKGVDWGVTLGEIGPFIGAAVLETLLVIQSNSSFGVSVNDDNKDKVFRYSLVSYATRVATVVAFLSTIITNVEEG